MISKINPLLEDLARLSEGKYYELRSLHVIDTLSKDLTQDESKKEQYIQVQSYNELFYVPLIIAIILYFLAVTKLHQLSLFILLLLVIPYKSDAGLLDFYYLHQADQNIKDKNFKKAAHDFLHVEPSVRSYYNIATTYYKAGEYKNALSFYSQIKTQNKKIKHDILYNMGNCAVKLHQYDKAKEYYINALALQEDKDTLHNLNLIRALKTEKQVIDNQKTPQEQKKSSEQKEQTKNSNNNSNSNSNRNSEQSTNGTGGEKKKKYSGSVKKTASPQKNNYKIGYKAYEIINKGYADEKEPW